MENLSFKIAQNEICLLKGASGSGKSTLLNIISGLKKPDNGNIILNNNVLNSENEFINPEKRNIGYVFQDFALFPHINAEKNIKYAMSINENVLFDRLSNELSLSNHLSKMPYELSGGQQQRVAISRAILMKPNLLLLDEPFSNLDQKNISSAQDLIKNILNEFKIPCLLVSHNPSQLETLSITNEITIG
jgi:ABC-type molybdate transport system ATPase subunit